MNTVYIEGRTGKIEVLENVPDHAISSIVFCHGICHDAWCWKYYLDFFPPKDTLCMQFLIGATAGLMVI